MSLFLNLFVNIAQAKEKAVELPANSDPTSFWSALLQANFFVQLTFLILVAMSIFSWAVIVFKFKKFKRLKEVNKAFLDQFEKLDSLDDMEKKKNAFRESNLSRVFCIGYKELKAMDSLGLGGEKEKAQFQEGLDNLERSLEKGIEYEMGEVEKKVGFLATIGSSAPFIGLFGTVLGITGSFQKIALYQSASLTVVAPGLAEALYATAVGLFAAIPATIAYNHFLSEIRIQEIALESFSKDFLNLVKRNFFKKEKAS